MNRETITLPRSVVEQALAALEMMGVPSPLVFLPDEIKSWQTVQAELSAALEQPQVEQEPAIYPEEAFDMGLEAIPYYTHPQNLRCKSTQARLATLWGYEKPQPPRQPLTDEEIIKLAREADLQPYYEAQQPAIERFAALVAAAEREACAKVSETLGVHPALNIYGGGPDWYKHGKDIAAAIRARGQA